MSSIAKISIETFDGKEQILFDFDKSKDFNELVETICKRTGLPESSKVYGLKFLPTKSNAKDHYITKHNLDEVKHSDCLKIVFSVDFVINRIVKHLHEGSADTYFKSIAFDDLRKNGLDPVFIDTLASSGNDTVILDVFISDHLNSEEQLVLLKVVVHLFSRFYITDTSKNLLQKALNILKNTDTTHEELRFTLSLLQKILLSQNKAFDEWKERIVREVALSQLVQYTWCKESRDLQYSALLLINTIIKVCKGDKKQQLIKEMNPRKTRENIYNFIIMSGNLDKNMEHELYVLQTYFLSLFSVALNSKISLDDTTLFKREEFELCSEDMRRITILMDFDDSTIPNYGFMSLENLTFNSRDSRISMASIRSEESLKASSKRSSTRFFSESEGKYGDNSISHLTLEALRYYKNNHSKNFYQSQIEEQLYEPGILITAERVVNMLAKMLHIGVDPPDSKSTFYQPVIFYCSSKTPFFSELFSRTMWLLSRTRREMKASTFADYEKVMYILKKQVKSALEKKPKNFKSLTNEMTATSYRTVLEEIQQEKEKEMNYLIENNPCVQELKLKYTVDNKGYVFRQRIHVLLQGAHFPKVMEKKVHGNIFVELSKNMKELLVSNVADVKTSQKTKSKETYQISDITHVVIGKNCQHSNLCQNPNLAFSIIVDHDEKIKFIAKDERTACYWTDALLLLIEGPSEKMSKFYTKELNELVIMDIKLQLLELQNVAIPKSPPPVPPPPDIVRPEVPPKPKIKRHTSRLI